eukprot:TRINITY_DN18781_c0_g1_i1.p1 TRINITY_DN18781_c0_g1~~TRINITY_DN18781_c0_g1_i1.p1  ORF type:complete len:1117 (-),score=455.11 TRINITY_DN18781_c0_g1_i1:188-3538(-)
MDQGKFVELLQTLQSTEDAKRKSAETLYQQAKESNADQLFGCFLELLQNRSVDEAVRDYSVVLMTRLLMRGPEKDFIFPKLSPAVKVQVAAALLASFQQEPSAKIRRKLGNAIATLAQYVCDSDDPRGHLEQGGNGWPQLLPSALTMANPVSNANPESCEAAVTLVKELVSTMEKQIVESQAAVGQVIQNCLAHPSMQMKGAALLLVCEMVSTLEKNDWAPLVATVPVLCQVLTGLAQEKNEQLLQKALQAFMEVAEAEPKFFEAHLASTMEPATFMSQLAKAKAGIADQGLRNLAIEWLASYCCGKRMKWVIKSLPAMLALVLEICMEFLGEIEDGEEALKEWSEKMDDEEGDEDMDEFFNHGEEVICRIVEEVGIEATQDTLLKLIELYASSNEWQKKVAALAAIRQTVEYVEDRVLVDKLATVLLQHAEHPHPRVRFAAMHALGQTSNDHKPHFQERMHKQVMPVLLQKFDDPCNRVSAMTMSAFTSFGEELDNALMQSYAQPFMEKLVAKLRGTQHRGVREEAITSIAVMAGTLEKDFGTYYGSIMPMLKECIMTCTGEKEGKLRGKAFECMSLLGLAVGKEQFLPDAEQAIEAMLKNTDEDETVKDYIKEATERICQCLQRDFARFCGVILPGILKRLQVEDASNQPGNADDDDDDDTYHEVCMGDGKIVTVKGAKFQELMQTLELLHTFATEMKSSFFPFVQQTAAGMVHLLSTSDAASYLGDEARATALTTWSCLIKCASDHIQENNIQGNNIPGELLQKALEVSFEHMKDEDDCESLAATTCGVTQCIKNAGKNMLDKSTILTIADKAFLYIDESMKRSKESDAEKKDRKSKGPAALADDDDEDEPEEEVDEEQCRRNFVEMLGACMSVAPEGFNEVLPMIVEKLKAWISTRENKTLGLYLACDMVAHLKTASQPAWPIFMPIAFNCINDKDADAGTASCYLINLAAPLPAFAEAAPDAFQRLAAVLNGAKPKKRDESGMRRYENAVAAMLSMAVEQARLCPAAVKPWELVLKNLPLRYDEEEAQKVHERLVDLLIAQNAGLLGENQAQLPQVFSVLSEVYKTENICTDETSKKIHTVFKSISPQILQQCAGSLTEKQQRKIEKMVSS